MCQKRWVLKPPADGVKVDALSRSLGIPPVLAQLLVQNGIETFEQSRSFFRPSLDQLYDPFRMKQMHQAVYRLEKAIQEKERILVYGDYDVDGVTSVSMFYNFLYTLYKSDIDIDFYISDRLTEGYGISISGIIWAAEQGFTLIVSLDCGVKSNDAIQYAYVLGIDVIVCDHHEPGLSLPNTYALLNPKQQGCKYPFKELSGCGVGFKLLQAFLLYKKLNYKLLYKYLDLVAISIACDLVSIVDENRILAYHGIKMLESDPQLGLQVLMDLIGVSPPISVDDIVFKIGPRINAAGRIGHAAVAVSLLISQKITTAEKFAKMINQHNNDRKDIDCTVTKEALTLIAQNPQRKQTKSSVLFDKKWHKGIIGIVASRCIEHYHRPTIILTMYDEKIIGSARSIIGFNIYDALVACSSLLEQYGGHAHAAGLTMLPKHITAFQQKFEEVVSNTIQDDLLIPIQIIHLPLSFKEITASFYKILCQMGPFGMGNRNAVFITENVYTHYCTILKGEHLKLRLYQSDGGGILEAIGFKLSDYERLVCTQAPFKIAYTIEENWYSGQPQLQLNLKAIKKM